MISVRIYERINILVNFPILFEGKIGLGGLRKDGLISFETQKSPWRPSP
jgi:hypothetical protein